MPNAVNRTLLLEPIVNCCGCVNVLTAWPASCEAVVKSSIFVLIVASPLLSGLEDLK